MEKMKDVGLTYEQEEEICYAIGEWYLDWKGRMTENHVPHCLGIAKEELKERICHR